MQKHKIFRLLTHAALTGICRSGGSVDTLIREFIRVSGCSPIHVRTADSATCYFSQSVSLVKSASICGASAARTCGFSSVSFLAFLAVQSNQCPSVFIRGSSASAARTSVFSVSPVRLAPPRETSVVPLCFLCIFVAKSFPNQCPSVFIRGSFVALPWFFCCFVAKHLLFNICPNLK